MADGVTIVLDTKTFIKAVKDYLAATDRTMDSYVKEIAYRVRTRLRAYTPVDTGRLVGNWAGPTKTADNEYTVSNDTPYAAVVEYGGYPGVGPRTVELQGRDLGEGYNAEPGIYSLQAPHGMVRRALADEARNLKLLTDAIKKNWGK